MDQKAFWIGGKHAVIAAIKNKRREVVKIVSTKPNPDIKKENKNHDIVEKSFFKKIFNSSDFSHQDIAALIKPLPKISLEDCLEKKSIKNILVLDGASDTRNIGAAIRNAVAFNIDSLLVEKKNFNEKSFQMHKVASGAIEHINIFQVSNLKNYFRLLKANNFWIIGFDSKAKKSFQDYKWNNQNVFVFGSEDNGIKASLLKECDELLKVDINPQVESLNLSCAISAVLCNYKIQSNLI